jgi:hypothetical protein
MQIQEFQVSKPGYAVIDRIAEGVATLLVGEDEIVVDLDTLTEGAKEGDWSTADTAGNFMAAPERTRERKKVILGKLDRLLNRCKRAEPR